MVIPDWIWFAFIFAFGCCIGSFLNVVIYRLPRDKSLIMPPSACPACGRGIQFYDNIPLVSWLLLGRKCRYCKASISVRYFVIELLTGLVFLILFILYFRLGFRSGLGSFLAGGWLVYLVFIAMLAALISASAIDLELWLIPLSICWFATAVGLIGSAVGGYIIDPNAIRQYGLLPSASANTGSLAAGASIGLVLSWLLLAAGLIKESYESADTPAAGEPAESQESQSQPQFNHRLEMFREIIFLLPIIVCSLAAYWFVKKTPSIHSFWVDFLQYPVAAGLLGSLWGYFVGCGIVWATRIFGTLVFGKEAMGLGDMHLMGAAGTVIGPVFTVIAFFIAPFFGLAWAGIQMFSKKCRQIPYGPFLSLAILGVIILHDRIFSYLIFMVYH